MTDKTELDAAIKRVAERVEFNNLPSEKDIDMIRDGINALTSAAIANAKKSPAVSQAVPPNSITEKDLKTLKEMYGCGINSHECASE